MPVANRTSKMLQQVYVDLWNTKYENKTPSGTENIAMYTNSRKGGKPWLETVQRRLQLLQYPRTQGSRLL